MSRGTCTESLMNFFEFENLDLKFKNILNCLNLNLKYEDINQIYLNKKFNFYKFSLKRHFKLVIHFLKFIFNKIQLK